MIRASTPVLTALALTAFAANSVLCRIALGQQLIDAASFAAVRVISGACVLALIALPRRRREGHSRTDVGAATALFVYMIFFSYAYVSLSAGTGALILFATVQLTMFAAALRSGEQFVWLAWIGLALAALGLVYLVLPGVTAPDPAGAAFMTVAGIAWGCYSLRGRGVRDPLGATANNFLLGIPPVVIVSFIALHSQQVSVTGIVLALASGALASGLGYVIWFAALRGLTMTRAATVQLSVPVIAAFGGVIFLSELLTTRLVLASAAVLGGIWLVLSRSTARTAS